MPKYSIDLRVMRLFTKVIEADSEDHAIELANTEYASSSRLKDCEVNDSKYSLHATLK